MRMEIRKRERQRIGRVIGRWKSEGGDGMRGAKSQKEERSRPGRGGDRGGRGDFTLAICWGCLTVQPPGGVFVSTSGGTLRVLLLLGPIDLSGYSDLFNCLLCPLGPKGVGRTRLSSSLPSC